MDDTASFEIKGTSQKSFKKRTDINYKQFARNITHVRIRTIVDGWALRLQERTRKKTGSPNGEVHANFNTAHVNGGRSTLGKVISYNLMIPRLSEKHVL